MKKISWLPIVILGLSTLALLVLFVLKAIDNNKQRTLISQTQTAAAATTWAQQTIAAIPTDTPTPTATLTPTPTPTPTSTPTETPTPEPSPTEEPAVVADCDEATFIGDVSIPDGTKLTPGQSFTKTWRLLNAGTCAWNPNYKLIFITGEQMSGPSSQQMVNLEVPPGSSIDVSVDLVAPNEPGTYRGYWGLKNDNNVRFGIGPTGQAFYLEIEVVEAVEE